MPLATSPNVRLVDTVPVETGMISAAFARTGPYFYTSSLDSISVFDTSDPGHPRAHRDGRQPGLRERGHDLRRAPTARHDAGALRAGGGRPLPGEHLRHPAREHRRWRADRRRRHRPDEPPRAVPGRAVPNSTHTVACVDDWDCTHAYSAGDHSEFSVIDLTDLDAPRVVGHPHELCGRAERGLQRWRGPRVELRRDWAWAGTPAPAARPSSTSPTRPRPVPVNGTDENGTAAGWNDFIHHNSLRPNGKRFKAGCCTEPVERQRAAGHRGGLPQRRRRGALRASGQRADVVGEGPGR